MLILRLSLPKCNSFQKWMIWPSKSGRFNMSSNSFQKWMIWPSKNERFNTVKLDLHASVTLLWASANICLVKWGNPSKSLASTTKKLSP